MATEQPAKTILITSPNSGEGKSVTTANLGVMMAQANFKTVIIDADLRRPAMHKIFQISNSKGLTDLLRSSELKIGSELKSTEVDNLQVITSGPLPPNPAELLSLERVTKLLQHLETIADIILLDSSPLLAVTDAIALSRKVEGVILVTQAKRTRRDAIQSALKRLDQVGAKILGSMLNRASIRGDMAYHLYYSRSGPSQTGQIDYPQQRRWWQRSPVSK